jgi:hypothetical protein
MFVIVPQSEHFATVDRAGVVPFELPDAGGELHAENEIANDKPSMTVVILYFEDCIDAPSKGPGDDHLIGHGR